MGGGGGLVHDECRIIVYCGLLAGPVFLELFILSKLKAACVEGLGISTFCSSLVNTHKSKSEI